MKGQRSMQAIAVLGLVAAMSLPATAVGADPDWKAVEQALGKPSDISKVGPVEQWTYNASNGTVVFLIAADKVTLQAAGSAPVDKKDKK